MHYYSTAHSLFTCSILYYNYILYYYSADFVMRNLYSIHKCFKHSFSNLPLFSFFIDILNINYHKDTLGL